MKLPSMQWYPGDWRKDPGVQALTYEERGIWFELLMLMHDCEPRGKLMLNGQPISHERIGNMVRLPTEKISQVISQLISLEVAGLDAETGALVSRRMVRDEEKRAKLSAFGKLGGNPAFEKGKDNPYHKPPHKPTTKPTISPSSSSSVSSSVSSSEEKKPPTPLPPTPSTPIGLWVEKLRDRHPTPCEPRFVHQFCFDNWHRLGEDGEKYEYFMGLVLEGLEDHCRYWAEDGNRFAMALDKWLNAGGWKKAPPERKVAMTDKEARIKRQEAIDASWEIT